MVEERFGFDAFAKKWLPPPPAWHRADEKPRQNDGESEGDRSQAYMNSMQKAGGETFVFSLALQDSLKADAAACLPIMSLLDRLLGNPEIGNGETAMILFQRVFGVPVTRARYIASWRPTNRCPEAVKALERVALCVADARRAGLWSPPNDTPDQSRGDDLP